jgi:malate dehydrogenase (oxaloacetate-decarboxylating)
LKQALEGADVFIGLSAPGALTPSFISRMERDPIVFALANPIPEIMPPVARKAGAVVVATGRSDFPNQINNVLAFPGVFRGALDAQVPRITHLMKLNAALAIAKTVKMPTSQHILPSALDNKVTKAVARAVQKSA